MMTTIQIESAARQLERSERGQMTCKMLLDFLKSNTVQGLDGSNSQAVAALVATFMLGGGADASAVMEALRGVVERNPTTG